MAIEYNFKYMPLVGKLSGQSMVQQTETAINEIAKIVNDNTAQAEIINTLAEEANANSVEALEKADEALETSSRIYVKETGAVDLDSYCESQLIYINNIFSQNLPVESKGFLEVKTNDDKTQATQVFVDDLNKEIYTRSGAITETQVGDVTTYTASYGAWNKSASTNYVENMVLIRQNSTAYSVGDIARSTALASYMLLECTSAGTTGASEPSFEGVDVGDVITDGSVSWTIIEYASTDYVDDSIANLKNTYLPANYLPLSGGTMTGNLDFANADNRIRVNYNNNEGQLNLYGGIDITHGAYLGLNGSNSVGAGGRFSLIASDGTNSTSLIGRPDGTLTWNNNNILTAAGGEINANAVIKGSGTFLSNKVNTSFTQINGGIATVDGATINLFGKDEATRKGYFYLTANNGSVSKRIEGRPDGTLQWNGQPIQTSSDKRLKTDFSDVPADVLESWSKVEWKQFKYKADVERKGENCRFHTGLVAQDVHDVCGDEILKYGILCHDVQEATEEQEAVDLWTVRYTEALCMEVIYLRNEIKKLREEIKALRTE